MIRQPYHLVEYSPWPFLSAMGLLGMASGGAAWLHFHSPIGLILGFTLTFFIASLWWRDVIRESTFQGYHNMHVCLNLRWGMILFILSEILFFAGFFWGFFHSSLAPTMELGCTWPPTGVTPVNPFAIPLLNTTILLSSGVSVTWAHHSLLENNISQAKQSLFLTIFLGMYFSFIQMTEYIDTSFTIADSAYGTSFFICTGFHGLHVLVGTMFLSVCLFRTFLMHFSTFHHFGFEAAAWYWHFVDVVWICLYILIYWWGS
uniref:cytochrome c oxidase subunit III n=1 Tax=Oligobrachia dogieli TaxID=3095170 RepID=UPI002E7A67E9|nr:cytochrome c oxidase subunit III [Oligobrachia dogieli]WPV72840.1 cytochrome c oxidase subunit III [Oligobrachia dogieli]